MIKREDVQILEVVLSNDEILLGYSMQVKDSIEAIVNHAGHVGIEPMEGNLFKNWIGVYALWLYNVSIKSKKNIDELVNVFIFLNVLLM